MIEIKKSTQLKEKFYDILRELEIGEQVKHQLVKAIDEAEREERENLQNQQKEIENGKGNVVQESTSKD